MGKNPFRSMLLSSGTTPTVKLGDLPSLARSDINPKDRQNYHSCIKLILDDVLNLLNNDVNAKGTVAYFTLLKMIVSAYIDRSTPIAKRKSTFETRKTINGIYLSIINF